MALLLSACGHQYVTPGGGASMFDLVGGEFAATGRTKTVGASLLEQTDQDLRAYYQIKPAASFPATVAVVRVQDSGYQSYSYHMPSQGRFSVITTRDIEADRAFDNVKALSGLAHIVPIGRMLVKPSPNTVKDLRMPAARLHADMLLVYTVDTSFTVDGRELGPLAIISLGLIPNKKAHVTATVSGMLVDVRTGFIYGTAEATDLQEQRATIWSTGQAIDTARLKAEKNAFVEFVEEFATLWPGVVREHQDRSVSSLSDSPLTVPSRHHVIRFETAP
jgi:hypothetical protein